MTTQDYGLFEIRFNDEGKRYIRKFVSISYIIFTLVVIECLVSIYWEVQMLRTALVAPTLYERIYPYVSMLFSLIALLSNFYYVRFPRVLLRSLERNDEKGANRSFGLMFKGAVIFMIFLILNTLIVSWSFWTR